MGNRLHFYKLSFIFRSVAPGLLRYIRLWFIESMQHASDAVNVCSHIHLFYCLITWKYFKLISHKTKWPPFRRRYFQMHFRKQKFCVLIKISLKCVPKGPNDSSQALVQIMACRLFGAWLSSWTHICGIRGDELQQINTVPSEILAVTFQCLELCYETADAQL